MSTAAAVPVLDNTFGALFLGVVLAMGLWGASTVQMYYYYDQYPRDAWSMKALVITVWSLDTAHQGLITHSAYNYLIRNYFNPAHLLVLEKTLLDMVLLNAIICQIVQGFFIYRAWRLSRHNLVLVTFLSLFSLGQSLSILIYYIKSFNFKTLAQLSDLFILEKVLNVFGVVSDFSIAGTLIFLLQRSRTGWKTTDSIVNRLILFSINTGAVTSLCAIFALIFVSVYPNTFIYITFYMLISKMYTNSLLATLNARSSVRGRGNSEDSASTSIHLSRMPNDVAKARTSLLTIHPLP
ncbi:hypothetical protein SCHPADRAFT_947285 [Schizopora paradoxa]|uniref:DUF6534 domain-containing protein n=1 Tax=Schizopora paradoxa TaxID=27342 RepID=A0A0H2QZQ2_9AGAM|nr:hypothetical protein SCHPADRAFT_947285 [Schizopora paradoxa]